MPGASKWLPGILPFMETFFLFRNNRIIYHFLFRFLLYFLFYRFFRGFLCLLFCRLLCFFLVFPIILFFRRFFYLLFTCFDRFQNLLNRSSISFFHFISSNAFFLSCSVSLCSSGIVFTSSAF